MATTLNDMASVLVDQTFPLSCCSSDAIARAEASALEELTEVLKVSTEEGVAWRYDGKTVEAKGWSVLDVVLRFVDPDRDRGVGRAGFDRLKEVSDLVKRVLDLAPGLLFVRSAVRRRSSTRCNLIYDSDRGL